MNRGSRRRNGRRGLAVVLAVAMLWSFASAAFAETYRTPGNEAAVGTNGSNANAQYLAFSDYGSASAGNGVALNYLGSANGGLAAASVVGPANSGLVAASGLGSANGSAVGASGTGPAGSTLVGVSATGPANGWALSVSGTGHAASSTYNGVAVSGAGTTSSGPGGVSVSGGNANGGLAGATVWGDSSGGTASVDLDRTTGTAATTAQEPLEETELVSFTGDSDTITAHEATVIATAPPPDPMAPVVAAQAYANTAPGTLYNLATLTGMTPPTSPEQTASSSSSTSVGDVPEMGIAWDTFWNLEPQFQGGCSPQTLHATWGHRGMPSNWWLYYESGAYQGNGVHIKTAAALARKYYTGPKQPQLDRPDDPADLMIKVTTAVKNWDQGVYLALQVAALHYWDHYDPNSGADVPTTGNHAVSAFGYVHSGGGFLWLADGVIRRDGQPSAKYGFHIAPVVDVAAGVEARGRGIIW